MNLNEYQEFATRTLPVKGAQHWFRQPVFPVDEPTTCDRFSAEIDLIHAVLGISGEAGELVDPVKKAMFYGKPLDVVNIREEAGDLLWYIAGPLCRALGCTLDELAQENVNKLRDRYPVKYTDAAAINRADKPLPIWAAPESKKLRKPDEAERIVLAKKYKGTLDFNDGNYWDEETRSWQPAPEMFDAIDSNEA